MDEEKIQSIFEQEGVPSDLSYNKALEIPDTFGITKRVISRFCSEHSIKIRTCQPGCFS